MSYNNIFRTNVYSNMTYKSCKDESGRWMHSYECVCEFVLLITTVCTCSYTHMRIFVDKENVYSIYDTFSPEIMYLVSRKQWGVSILQRIVPLHFYIYKHRTSTTTPTNCFHIWIKNILYAFYVTITYKVHIRMNANKHARMNIIPVNSNYTLYLRT